MDIWCEVMIIFMILGYGGCYFLGLVFVVMKWGFKVDVVLNICDILFINGVRSEKKKVILYIVYN